MNSTPTNTKTEQELILACARTCPDAAAEDRVRSLATQPINWQHIIAVSHTNGILPLLYKNLKALCPDAPPVSVMRSLQDIFYHNLARNLSMEEQLRKILGALDQEGIPAIPYKGAALAASVYGDVAFRVFSDLDIIIQRPDIQRAMEVLVSLGYIPSLQLDPQQMEGYLHNFYEIPFAGNRVMASVELQWEIAADHFVFPIAPLELWDDNPAADTSGYRSVAPEKLLLMLCVHGAKDSWERLAWICDVSELLRTYPELDWETLLMLAKKTGGLRMLGLGLDLAHTLLDADVPEEIRRRLCQSRVIKNVTEEIPQRLFTPNKEPAGVLETCLFYMRIRERVSDRVRFCARTMLRPIPGEWERLGCKETGGRVANLRTHLATGLNYALGFAKQKFKEASQTRNS